MKREVRLMVHRRRVEKVTNITNQIGTLKSYDGKTIEESADTFDITENNAFSLNVADIEQYLRDTGSSDNLNGYKKRLQTLCQSEEYRLSLWEGKLQYFMGQH